MATQKVKLYIQARKSGWEDKFSLVIDTMAFESTETTLTVQLNTVELDIEVPELDEKMLSLAQVEQLRDQIKAEKAAHYLRVTGLEDKINSLMCLENKSE